MLPSSFGDTEAAFLRTRGRTDPCLLRPAPSPAPRAWRPHPALGFGARSGAPLPLSRHVIRLDAARAAPRGRGEAGPLHRARARRAASRPWSRARCRGCSPTPTPTRSGCPTRACRSSTRSSTSATTPSPSAPTPPGATSRPSCAASASRCSRSTPTVRRHEFDVLAFNLSAELTYTNLLNCVDLAGVPGAGRRAAPRAPAGGRGRALHLQPRAAGRLPRLRRAGRRRGGRVRDHRGDRASGRRRAAPRAAARPSCAS